MTETNNYSIGIVGAGLAGSMTALLLANLGFKISIFEKRSDSRQQRLTPDEIESLKSSAFGASTSAVKRSINLALSDRGMAALKEVRLLTKALKDTTKMSGRVIHLDSGKVVRQQYGTKDQALYSISRQDLNHLLLDELQSFTSLLNSGSNNSQRINLYFGYTLIEATKDGKCIFNTENSDKEEYHFDLVIGADGAYSAVRDIILRQGRVDFSRQYISHGYKELRIPPAIDPTTNQPTYALTDYKGLHIWPRKQFMLIALPNADKSFTATLFAPYRTETQGGFDSIDADDPEAIRQHFLTHFPDVVPLMPNLAEEYKENPVGSLVTVRLKPWAQGKLLLIGDAAHAVVPFYGQGMNAAFEDALILYNLIKERLTVISAATAANNNTAANTVDNNIAPTTTANASTQLDFEEVAMDFSNVRSPATDGLADLCIEHYADMAFNTTSLLYLITRRVEGIIHSWFPNSFLPLYSMIAFSTIPYHEALQRAKHQERVVSQVVLTGVLGVAAAVTVATVKFWPLISTVLLSLSKKKVL